MEPITSKRVLTNLLDNVDSVEILDAENNAITTIPFRGANVTATEIINSTKTQQIVTVRIKRKEKGKETSSTIQVASAKIYYHHLYAKEKLAADKAAGISKSAMKTESDFASTNSSILQDKLLKEKMRNLELEYELKQLKWEMEQGINGNPKKSDTEILLDRCLPLVEPILSQLMSKGKSQPIGQPKTQPQAINLTPEQQRDKLQEIVNIIFSIDPNALENLKKLADWAAANQNMYFLFVNGLK